MKPKPPSHAPTHQQAAPRQIQQIGSSGLVHRVVTDRVGREGVHRVGMPQGVAYERVLTVVEIRVPAQSSLGFRDLAGLPRQIALQFLDGPQSDVQLVQNEVREVEVICLRVQERAGVLCGGAPEYPGDRQVLREPVP